jgi:2-polyprenyl-3-methyl-5-hydroxy-6-metoxy-1,4-benzoquinol methylase
MAENSVSTFFDSYSGDFNAIYGSENGPLSIIANRLLRRCIKLRYIKTIRECEPIEGKSVIDIGCGPGHYGIALARKGAKSVWGIDFAKGMIDLAKQNAECAGVADKCNFILGDFLDYTNGDSFDYSIVIGVMDYVEKPREFILKVLSITRAKAFFSFPADGGILAWQRKIRYKKRCRLLMYNAKQVSELFAGMDYGELRIERVDRDFYVTVYME